MTAPGGESADAREFSFSCTMCGGCCNSAPQLSLPELFHHQHRFIGCLAIRRVPRLQPGQPWSLEPSARADAADCEAFDALAAELLLPVQGPTAPEFVLVAAQAFDDSSKSVCPALGSDQRCSVQFDRKPQNCLAVPLEPLLPDRMQPPLLAQRAREAVFLGAECIARGPRPGHLPLVSGSRVVDPVALEALTARRRGLAEDLRFWGSAVFKLLRAELFDHPERVGRLPTDGFFSLSLAPALAVIASASPLCRKRCVSYLNAQIELTAEALGADSRASPAAKQELLGLLRASVALRASLQKARAVETPGLEAAAVEAWLGLTEEPIPTLAPPPRAAEERPA
jgi:hypothetical protein